MTAAASVIRLPVSSTVRVPGGTCTRNSSGSAGSVLMSSRADQDPVLEDPPAALAVTGDRRRIYAAPAGREVEAVPVRAADAQPGFRAGHVHSAGDRVVEVAEAAAPGGAESFWQRRRHGGQV